MNDLVAWASLAPLLALVGSLINAFFGRSLKEPAPGIIASVAVGLGFVLSLLAFFGIAGTGEAVRVGLWDFLRAGDLELSLGFHLDQLSVLMMLIITGVGFLIHVYSIGYMHGDDGYSRYFAQMNLFVASMLVLVMADSFVFMFVGWEGVGVCSFLLIGFWYKDLANASAGRKAFIVNRVGDFGFLVAMFLTFKVFGTLDIQTVNAMAPTMLYGSAALTGIGLLYLLAATGKSAQLPLQVWLPDAMAGPTPVSALIHAATMVTAGVYLIARTSAVYAVAPGALATVAWVGVLTALIAAIAAVGQTDIKRVLAYSTISQVGFMIAAVGAGAYWAGIFHVFTHAFFKGLLFLAAGSVMHALGGEQDMRKMGGLGKRMKITGTTALIATLAIAGVPFLSSFFSKDAILAATFTSGTLADAGGGVLYALLLITAGITALYMFRWYYLVFAGPERLDRGASQRVHESPGVMTVPLVVLAIGSVLAGYVGLPAFLTDNRIMNWLSHSTTTGEFTHLGVATEWLMLLGAVVVAFIGLGVGYWVYVVGKGALVKRLDNTPIAGASRGAFGFDALYKAVFVDTGSGAAEAVTLLDREVVDRGFVGLGGVAPLLGGLIRRWQSGNVRAYAFAMLLGAAGLTLVAALVGVLK
ncbi:MAG: NADH-quinone oxidoreductase subunit L [Trueperaceae bacterium]|jgi:NADH-quinone oxidoreductase subunit L|nr:NADH-quinone oxidoreductase subunit L [Trueperaceae bacterium]HRQ11009.1 NADH-quinone oxidoreductase subunit L [Trueperaceae bacterium]